MIKEIMDDLYCDGCGADINPNEAHTFDITHKTGQKFSMLVCDDCYEDFIDFLDR